MKRRDLKRLIGVNFQAPAVQLQVQEAKLRGAFSLCKDGAGSGRAMRRHEGSGPVTPGAAQLTTIGFCALALLSVAQAHSHEIACAAS